MTDGQRIIARARDFAAQHALVPPGPRAATVASGARSDAERIADDMLDIAAVSSSVTIEDLALRGWPLEVLNRHVAEARDIANSAAERSVQ